MNDTNRSGEQPSGAGPKSLMRQRFVLGFGLFGLFFAFYLGTAILQTPAFRQAAATPCLGMPVGLLMSLLIFPVSWLLIVVFFLKSR